MEFALSEYSEDPRVGEVELLVEDHGADPVRATSQVQSLISRDGVSAIVGLNQSQVALAVAPIFAQQHVPAVSDAVVDPEFAAASPYTFLGKPPTSDLVDDFLSEWSGELGTRAAVLYNDEVPSVAALLPSWEAGLEKNGIEVVAKKGHQLATTDFQANISSVLSDDPDLIVALDVPNKSALIFSQARQLGFEGQFSGLSVLFNDQTLSVAGSAAEGLLFPAGWHPDSDRGTTAEFVEAFKAKNGGAIPELANLDGYMTVKLVIEAAIRAGSTEPEAIRGALETIELETPYGEWSFDDEGVPNVSGLAVTVKNGAFVLA